MVEHINRIAVEWDLYGGKRVATLTRHRPPVAGSSAISMSVSDVSEGAGNFLPDFRHRNVALATIIDERYLAVLCKALDLILVLDVCIEQFSASDVGKRPFLPCVVYVRVTPFYRP